MEDIQFPKSINNIAILSSSHVTRELPIALLGVIRFVHPYPEKVNCVGEFRLNDETTLYIIICPAGLGSERYVTGPKYYITYQLEPTPILERETYRDFLSKAICNWDYSQVNVDFLRKYPEINIRYLPPGYSPYIAANDISDGRYYYTDDGKDVDVLFLGWDMYERRKKIKEELIQAGLKIWFVHTLDLEGMKQAIRRAKVCINIHVFDIMPCLETIRLNILLSNQACVVNEFLPDDELDVYKDNIMTVSYDHLVSTCVDLVNNLEKRRRLALRSHQWYRNERAWNKIVDFNSILPSLTS